MEYDQDQVNEILSNTFDLNNNLVPFKKKSGPGGRRPGAGRKKGSVNKIQGGEFLVEYRKVHGNDLKEDLARDMYDARARGDYEMLFRYQTAFAKYYFSDVAAQDVTTGGKSFNTVFNFPTKELDDWKD